MTLDQIVSEMCRSTGITIDAVRSASRSRTLSRARALIAIRAIDSNVASLTQIARYFNRSVSPFRGLLTTIARRMRRDPEMQYCKPDTVRSQTPSDPRWLLIHAVQLHCTRQSLRTHRCIKMTF